MGRSLEPAGQTGRCVIRICFHGAESTGKSVLIDKLGGELGLPWVAEYGRTYCEERGTDLAIADLLAIAAGQQLATAQAAAAGPALLLLDTDQLMTAAWAGMLFGTIPPALLAYPKADLYLLFAADTPWRDDGTRMFGTAAKRARFAALAEEVLVRTGVRYQVVNGSWAEREAQVRAAIGSACAQSLPPG